MCIRDRPGLPGTLPPKIAQAAVVQDGQGQGLSLIHIYHNETSLKSVNGWDPGRSGTGPGRGSQKGLCQGPDLLVDGLDGAQPARLVHTADHLPA